MDWEKEIEGSNLNTEEVMRQVSEKLSSKYKEAREKLQAIESFEQQIQQAKDELKKITEEEMPELMDSIGVSSITLSSGEMIKVDSSIHCGIPAERKSEAYGWLRDHNHGDIIKNEVTIKFNRNEDNLVGDVKARAEELGLRFEQKEKVEPMTLKAFAKEQMRSGTPLPQDLFGVYIRRAVIVK